MLTNNDKITVPQTVAIMITSIIQIGLSLPREAAVYGESDGWLLVIIGGILAFLASLVLSTLIRRFPNDTFIEYSEKVVGKVPALILGIVLIIYFAYATSVIVQISAEVINAFMLQRTPREFVIITQMLLTVYLIRHGVEPMARIAEILFPVLIVPIFAMYFIAIPKADFTELLPILNTPLKSFALGSLNAMFSFFGIEILLMLGPYMRSPKRIYWVMFVSVGVSTLIFLFVVIVVFASIGVENTKILLWPGMTIIRSITAPGRFIERLDALALALWTIASFTSLNTMYFAGSLALAHIAKVKEFKFFITILFPWIYLFATIPPNIIVSSRLLSIVKIGSITVGFLIPLVILLLAIIMKKEGKTA
ncbi:MAG TPA: endospore germination permease [Thermoanaerobacterales bacterium]|nr:endospore germination permease [Thermoanaerobacterales bacterium]